MGELKSLIESFLENSRYIKGLSYKTLKAYSIDLRQFSEFCTDVLWREKETVEAYIKELYIRFKPKSAKRKIACLKVFFHFLENNDFIETNPFRKITIKHRESIVLPKVIPVRILTKMLEVAYERIQQQNKTEIFYKYTARDIAVMEILFATGIRVYELCNLRFFDVDLKEKYIKVYGKGSKERYIQITNRDVLSALKNYQKEYKEEITTTGYFFVNNRGNKISEQSVRFMVDKYAKLAGSTQHITPHMFRHTVATLLLEEDVDIRYIQDLLGHSSITTTQIYTHISLSAQKRVLKKKHPRNKLNIKISI